VALLEPQIATLKKYGGEVKQSPTVQDYMGRR
jgi:hypothetical protein